MVMLGSFYDYVKSDLYVKLYMILINKTCHNELLRYDMLFFYEGMYEVGCIMWFLVFDMVMGFYSWHCTSISWVLYMLGWYHVW